MSEGWNQLAFTRRLVAGLEMSALDEGATGIPRLNDEADDECNHLTWEEVFSKLSLVHSTWLRLEFRDSESGLSICHLLKGEGLLIENYRKKWSVSVRKADKPAHEL